MLLTKPANSNNTGGPLNQGRPKGLENNEPFAGRAQASQRYASGSAAFEMLCLAVEKAHALHTGNSYLLLMNFELREVSDSGHLPRVRPLGNLTFIVDEAYLKASVFTSIRTLINPMIYFC